MFIFLKRNECYAKLTCAYFKYHRPSDTIEWMNVERASIHWLRFCYSVWQILMFGWLSLLLYRMLPLSLLLLLCCYFCEPIRLCKFISIWLFIDMQQSMDYYVHWTVKQYWTHNKCPSFIGVYHWRNEKMRAKKKCENLIYINLIIRVAKYFFIGVHLCPSMQSSSLLCAVIWHLNGNSFWMAVGYDST